MMRKKTALTAITILFCVVAIWAGINNTAVVNTAWHLWYGNRIKWNEMDIQVNSGEYFMPMSKSGKTLIIADSKFKDAFIVLHAENRTREFQKTYVDNLCRPNECGQLNEQTYTIDGRRIDSFSIVKVDADSNLATYHQYLVVDGGNTWVEFFGEEARYATHKPTIDSIVKLIAQLKSEQNGPGSN